MKASGLSIVRAEAANPLLASATVNKFIAHVEQLKQKGVIPNTGPLSDRVLNVDELGFDLESRARPTISLFRGDK
jgi:hypothetical protein